MRTRISKHGKYRIYEGVEREVGDMLQSGDQLTLNFFNGKRVTVEVIQVTCSRHLNDWRRSEVGASRSRHLMVPVSAGYPRAPHGSSDCVPTVVGGGVGPRRGCSWRRSRPGRAMRRTPGTPTRARPNPWCPRIGSRSRSTVGWTDTIC